MALLGKSLEVVSRSTSFASDLLSDAKTHIRVDGTADDAYLLTLIEAALDKVETDTRRTFVDTTYTHRRDGFPAYDSFKLNMPVARSVSSIAYTNTTGGTTVLPTSVYELDSNETPGYVRLKYNQTWPTARVIQNAVSVTYTAGSTSADTMPKRAKLAVMQLVEAWYCDRSPEGAGTAAYDALVGGLRLGDYR